MGYNEDPQKEKVKVFESMVFDDITSFYKRNVNSDIYNIMIVADLSRIDIGKLEEYGKIVYLQKSDIFN